MFWRTWLLCTVHVSIENDLSIKNQCLLRQARYGENAFWKHVCVPVYVMAEISTQECDVAYFCQCYRAVNLVVSDCFHVYFLMEELCLICLLAVIDKNDGCSKMSLFFCVFNSSNQWTFCTGRKFPQVDRGFFTVLPKYNFAVNIFPSFETIIYSLRIVGSDQQARLLKWKSPLHVCKRSLKSQVLLQDVEIGISCKHWQIMKCWHANRFLDETWRPRHFQNWFVCCLHWAYHPSRTNCELGKVQFIHTVKHS